MKGSDKAARNYVHKLGFGVKDAFQSARYGFNARNMWAFWKGILASWLTWAFFTYMGFLAAGDSMSDRLSSSVLCPLPDRLFMSSVPAVILLAAGTLLAAFILMRTFMKVSRMTFEQLRGDQFYSEKDAARFCSLNWKPLVQTPLTILTGLAVGAGLLALAGLTGRIPWAGPWIASLLAIPAWGLGILLLFSAVVLLISFFLTPTVIACTSGDAFECLFELFSITSSRPGRLLGGVLAGVLVRIPAMLLLIGFSWGSLAITGAVLDGFGGTSGSASSMESGMSLLAPDLAPFYSSIFSPVSATQGVSGQGAGIVLAAAGAAILLALVSYWLSSCAAMWTIIYLGARHSRDGEDLILRAEEEEYREFRKVYGSTDHAGDRSGR